MFTFAHGFMQSQSDVTTDFVSVWRTTTDPETITLPATSTSNNFTIFWGDGSQEVVTTASPSHEYAVADDYEIRISGICPTWYQNNAGDKLKLIKVLNLGVVGWSDINRAFWGCSNLTEVTIGNTNIINITDMTSFVAQCASLEILDLTGLDTSSVTSMVWMMYSLPSMTATPDLTGLDTSSVTDMQWLMRNWPAITTPPDISGFNTALVTNMSGMLQSWTSVGSIDIPIDDWDIGLVSNMSNMLVETTLTTTCYDRVLIAWEGQAHQINVIAHFGYSKYTEGGAAETARDGLVLDGWTVTDGGPG